MYICVCNAFTDRQIRASTETRRCSVADVYKSLGCTPKCGKCVPVIREMLKSLDLLPLNAEEAA